MLTTEEPAARDGCTDQQVSGPSEKNHGSPSADIDSLSLCVQDLDATGLMQDLSGDGDMRIPFDPETVREWLKRVASYDHTDGVLSVCLSVCVCGGREKGTVTKEENQDQNQSGSAGIVEMPRVDPDEFL